MPQCRPSDGGQLGAPAQPVVARDVRRAGLSSRRERPGLLVVVACFSLAVLVVLGLTARSDEIFSWDARFHAWLQGYSEPDPFNAFVDDAIGLLVRIGADVILFGTILVAVSVLAARRRVREIGFVLASVAGTIALTYVLKEVFARDTASAYGDYSVPSGHAARSLAVVAAVVALTWTTRWRWWAVSLGGIFVVALGVSLMYEDWHLPSDVLGGWALAIAVVATMAAAFLARARRPTAGTVRPETTASSEGKGRGNQGR